MTEKYSAAFEAGLRELRYKDLQTNRQLTEVEKALRTQIHDKTEQIGQKAIDAANILGDDLPDDIFKLPLAVIAERPDEQYDSVQLATVLKFHPRTIEKRTGFGHLSEGYEVDLAPKERFEEVATYIIPKANADTDQLTTLGVRTKGLLVATEPLILPPSRNRLSIRNLHAEVHRLDNVMDLVEGTAVGLRRDVWSSGLKPPHYNYQHQDHR